MQAQPESTLRLQLRPHLAARDLTLALERGPSRRLDPARPLLVGSGDGSDLRLVDPTVSARHARIAGDAGGLVVEDLGSTNGTFVDGVRVERAWLRPGQRLGFGGCRGELLDPGPGPAGSLAPAGMIGASPAFQDMLRALARFAPLPHPVLLQGETGTGKELAARALHDQGPRAGGPFVALNCGAIPDALCESELFGHVRGAFTGAARTHVGAFERAHGGTLFLDEVAELPLILQAKLLRVLETRRMTPVGGEHERTLDVRVVSATHQPLERLGPGRFRGDLYHRLSVLMVRVPALAERPDDIPLLLRHFAAELAHEFGRPLRLGDDALEAARRRRWPGNIRELRNALTRAAARHEGPIGARELLPEPPPPPPSGDDALTIPRGTYDEKHRALLLHVLRDAGSIRRAAQVLDVPRSTLSAWLREPDPAILSCTHK